MPASNPLTAEILEASVTGFAAAANAKLRNRITTGPSGPDSAQAWKSNLMQRILELATAVRVDDPALFARRIDWLRLAYRARGADEQDLRASIESLREALDEELPEHLRGDVSAPIELALDTLSRAPEPAGRSIDPATDEGRLALLYMESCLQGRTAAAMDLVLDSAQSGRTPESIYLDVLIPAQRETGRLWHTGDIGVAEERLVSETTRQLIAILSHRYKPATQSGRSVLAAAVAGNAHDIGIRVVAELFRLAGWNSVFLGADVPAAEIAKTAQLFDVDLVVLNATLTTHLNEVSATIAEIRRLSPRSRILVGGLAFDGSAGLWQTVGADGFSESAATAVATGTSLIAS